MKLTVVSHSRGRDNTALLRFKIRIIYLVKIAKFAIKEKNTNNVSDINGYRIKEQLL